MSAHVLLNSTRLIQIPDDLESFFHVLIYFAIRFLPHNLTDNLVGRFLYSYFDDYTDGAPGFTCGLLKYTTIKRGVIDVAHIIGNIDNEQNKEPLVFFEPQSSPPSDDKDTGNTVATKNVHPITALISKLLEAFQLFYAKSTVKKAHSSGGKAKPAPMPLALATTLKKLEEGNAHEDSVSDAEVPSAPDSASAKKVESHTAMQVVILQHLHCVWPLEDKGGDKKPLAGYVSIKENTTVGSTIQTGSKRATEDGKESMSRRVQSRSRV